MDLIKNIFDGLLNWTSTNPKPWELIKDLFSTFWPVIIGLIAALSFIIKKRTAIIKWCSGLKPKLSKSIKTICIIPNKLREFYKYRKELKIAKSDLYYFNKNLHKKNECLQNEYKLLDKVLNEFAFVHDWSVISNGLSSEGLEVLKKYFGHGTVVSHREGITNEEDSLFWKYYKWLKPEQQNKLKDFMLNEAGPNLKSFFMDGEKGDIIARVWDELKRKEDRRIFLKILSKMYVLVKYEREEEIHKITQVY